MKQAIFTEELLTKLLSCSQKTLDAQGSTVPPEEAQAARAALEKFEDGAVVDAKAMLDAGILSKCTYGVKILGNGEITKKLTVKASAFSESAKAKIEAAGGKAEVV